MFIMITRDITNGFARMNVLANVNAHKLFRQKLMVVMQELHELFELSKEHDLDPVSADGVTRYLEEDGKTGFHVTNQFARPSEFLESLLDIIRVNFDPCAPGTFFLNANMGLLYDAMPSEPFQLGYASMISAPGKPFAAFWKEDVVPYLKACGYDIDRARSVFAVASTGMDNYGVDFFNEVSTTLESGFSLHEAKELISSHVRDLANAPIKHIHAGYCMDAGLGSKMRLSFWLVITDHDYKTPLDYEKGLNNVSGIS